MHLISGIFFVYLIFIDCFVLVMTIMILRFHNQPDRQAVPKPLLKICFVDTDDSRSYHGNGAVEADEKGSTVSAQTVQANYAEDWKAVARMVDKYLCALVAVVTVFFLVVIGFVLLFE